MKVDYLRDVLNHPSWVWLDHPSFTIIIVQWVHAVSNWVHQLPIANRQFPCPVQLGSSLTCLDARAVWARGFSQWWLALYLTLLMTYKFYHSLISGEKRFITLTLPVLFCYTASGQYPCVFELPAKQSIRPKTQFKSVLWSYVWVYWRPFCFWMYRVARNVRKIFHKFGSKVQEINNMQNNTVFILVLSVQKCQHTFCIACSIWSLLA